MPAVYDLANGGLLPPGFSLIGFARRDWEDEDFAQIVHDSVKEHSRTPFQPQSGQAGGCPHDDAPKATLSSVACTAVTRTSIPGNSTSSTAAAPTPGLSPRENVPAVARRPGIHGIAA